MRANFCEEHHAAAQSVAKYAQTGDLWDRFGGPCLARSNIITTDHKPLHGHFGGSCPSYVTLSFDGGHPAGAWRTAVLIQKTRKEMFYRIVELIDASNT